MPTKKRPSKKTLIKETRAKYQTLNRAYHKAGKKAFGKPSRSVAKRDYLAIKRERNRVGAQLGRLTGVR